MPNMLNMAKHHERRRWTRVETSTPTRVSSNGTSWEGRTVNMSLGGVCMAFGTSVSASTNQPIQLGLETDAGVIELKGAIRNLNATGFAVEFEALEGVQGQIFASVLEGIREHTISVKLVGTLVSQDTGDLLLEISTGGAAPLDIAEVLPGSSTAEEDSPTAPAIISKQIEFKNASGRRIVAYHDAPLEPSPHAPLAVLAPGYGETKKEYVMLSYYFASNGFHVLRYDHTNHVGESEGDIAEATLSNMGHDLDSVLDYAKQTWPTSPIAVVATSLSGRVAFKQVAQSPQADLLVLLTGIVDVQTTLTAVHQEDHMMAFLRGTNLGTMNVLGFNIDADRFVNDAFKAGYASLASTLKDARQIQTPVIFFAAEHDAWVDLESVKAVQRVLGEKSVHMYLIPEALHCIQENPRKARAVFRQLIACCLEQLLPEASGREILEPSKRAIGLQSRLERERARAHHHMAKTEMVEFWKDYLDNFHYIANISDYWQLLDHIYRMVGNLDGGMRILDAGCGNGNFGMFLLINQAYRQRNHGPHWAQPIHYVGADFILPALAQARLNLMKTAAEIRGKFLPNVIAPSLLMDFSLLAADLNMPLPFRDGQFDRIVCNLVIGYLQDPSFLITEFLRVLSPSGRLIITNLKPHPDLSLIYRNFVQRTARPEELQEAKHLLNNSGKIIQAESNGVFRFFDRQELAMLLIASGAAQPRVCSAFANQAYIAVTEKPPAIHTVGVLPIQMHRPPSGRFLQA
jgi:alpha-beta hydrolase superfamily lysophospholipase/SAM-dependent methyltransferase